MSWRNDYDAPHEIQPPTYFKTNDVTTTHQMITDTYGVPSYGEANPSVFSVVTFPFLFAVMFGDYGHGSLILFVAAVLVIFKDRLEPILGRDVMIHRYMFLLMGIFSCWNGFLYNEWFAIPYPWFNSCYYTDEEPTASQGYVFPFVDFPFTADNVLTPDYYNTTCVYPVGMDPTWFLASNQILTVQNSVKMKISVIIAIAHMSMGVVVKGLNALYDKQKLVFWFEVVTGMIILNGLFGWMDFLIIYKWFYQMNPYSTDPEMIFKITSAPSIISVMINNFLGMGKQPYVGVNGTTEIYMFNGQRAISEAMVVLVFICVPLMLFVKPCSYMCCPAMAGVEGMFDAHPPASESEAAAAERIDAPDAPGYTPTEKTQLIEGSNSEAKQRINEYQQLILAESADDHGNHSVQEVFIHQLIETIEFVLGAVSNTASYLRLWALSLAHSQLALVFLEQILQVPWKALP